MFANLVVSTLILGSVVTVPPPRAEGEKETSAAAMTDFRCTFKDYEEDVKQFMDSLKVESLPVENVTSRKLYEALMPYIALFPRVETRVVAKKYREKCWCDGSMSSPCPEKCINSCRWLTDNPTSPWKNENDCEGAKSRMTPCYCYEGSSTTCNNGNLSNCYEERTEVEAVNTNCSQYSVAENDMKEGILLMFSITFVDPLRHQFQTITNQLSSLKQAVIATDSLFNFTYASCCEKRNETQCYPEASSVLKEKLTEFVQLKKDMNREMSSLHTKVDTISDDAKSRAMAMTQGRIRKYERCMKGLGYSDTDNECEGSSCSTLPSPPSPTTS